MNYLEIINKCLVELNYKQVNSFSELVKNDHKKIKNIINIINSELCGYDKWEFLLRKTEYILQKNTGDLKNTVKGRIAVLIIDGERYEYTPHFELFATNSRPACKYTILNNMLLFPLSTKDRKIEIYYYTSGTAVSAEGDEKPLLILEDDNTLIPMPFAEPLLVYGTCLRLKANPQHVKFSYWMSMYNAALANFRSNMCVDINDAPEIKMNRR